MGLGCVHPAPPVVLGEKGVGGGDRVPLLGADLDLFGEAGMGGCKSLGLGGVVLLEGGGGGAVGGARCGEGSGDDGGRGGEGGGSLSGTAAGGGKEYGEQASLYLPPALPTPVAGTGRQGEVLYGEAAAVGAQLLLAGLSTSLPAFLPSPPPLCTRTQAYMHTQMHIHTNAKGELLTTGSMRVCMRVCMRACMCACVVCVRARARARVQGWEERARIRQ